MKYIELDCKFEHEGQSFEALGAIVTDNTCVAYLGENGILTDWHGRALGTYEITHKWRLPWNSWVSTHMHQVEAIVNHITYTGRSCGVGTIYRGRRKKCQ